MAWAADRWADEHRPVPSANPKAVLAIINRWADALEKRARRCRGCGEWTFGEMCEWCADVCELRETYGFRWLSPGWAVTHAGQVVHRAATLLEAENWVTRGGADTHETAGGTATIGSATRPHDAGGAGAARTAPHLAEPGLEVRRGRE